MQNFRTLKVWEKAHALTLAVYKATRAFPKEEMYGLTSQIRRASSSIACNIAEGTGRGTKPDFARMIQIAIGSSAEVDYQLLLTKDLEYLPTDDYQNLHSMNEEVKRMLTGLLQKLQS
ncbi:MAG: four helix bundle protein [Candidatus Kapaibacterium sp.]